MSDGRWAGDPRGEPHWHPVTELPWIAALIDEQVESLLEAYENMDEVRDRPYLLDDALVDRTVGILRETLENAWVFDEQLARWKREGVSGVQEWEVDRLMGQMANCRVICEKFLELAGEMRKGTIDRVMSMDEREVVMLVLREKLKQPGYNN